MGQVIRHEAGLRHACSFHRSASEQVAIARPFLEAGIAGGERCIVISDERDAWKSRLLSSESGATRLDSGLSVWSSDQWRLPGRLNSLRMASHVWRLVEDSLNDYAGLRIVVDMAWTLVEEVPGAAVCHWEATLDLLHSRDLPVQMLCQYDYARLPVAFLHAALRTHAAIVAGERVLPNLYYEAPAILENEPELNECSSDAAFVHGLLRQFIPLS